MEKTIDVLAREMSTMRTSRATPQLVEHVKVDYHGIPTPLNQLASITAPEVNLIRIQPWERSMIGAIEKAILKANLGLSPSNDGAVVRVTLPPLTDDRRHELVKVVHKRLEEARVVLRNQRRDGVDRLKALEKEKMLPKDEAARLADQIQRLTDAFIDKVNKVGIDKEAEIAQG
jgi:ribosome recycling factor